MDPALVATSVNLSEQCVPRVRTNLCLFRYWWKSRNEKSGRFVSPALFVSTEFVIKRDMCFCFVVEINV